ncbi:MAG: hypothetical protein AVDCRST_MAG03-1800 [uncultured Rubrobacteraceae bacterium]|uniref:Uncharacterized protein n=1 Tax=uncultured Rubrobacteraceae bacterium TaxID=349277 RepID=A0A6J4PDP3_9ACTN|nr:MAG: hypothetical protein AVDCRST_MAG03-1800 [uncultured Rubrobacteraceae bacterium]
MRYATGLYPMLRPARRRAWRPPDSSRERRPGGFAISGVLLTSEN